MKRAMIVVGLLLALLIPLAAPAQNSLPASVRNRYLVMPEPAAHNLAGMSFTPWSADRFYKGNLHCHSNTDGERMARHGDGPPELSLKWYADHGYDFVVLTDHNVMHPPLEVPPGLLYITGEEVTYVGGSGNYHINGLGTTSYIRPKFGADRIEAYQYAADAIVAQGGVAQLNHPITPLAFIYPEDFLALRNIALFEVYNMQPGNYNSLGEPLWDNILTRGAVYWGTMTDDAHLFRVADPVIVNPPGGGFVMVAATEPTQPAILEALRQGRFYGSSGVLIKKYAVTMEAITVEVEGSGPFEIKFIGAQGKVLKTVQGARAEYAPAGDELYVRARVEDKKGKIAILQPVFYR